MSFTAGWLGCRQQSAKPASKIYWMALAYGNAVANIVGTWSRGMKQKLAVARAMLPKPSLIFLDEPTAGLDPVAASALRHDLAAVVARDGVTVFLTTHNLTEAEQLCSRVGVIRAGRLLAVNTTEHLRAGRGARRVEVAGRGFGDELLAHLRARPDVIAAQRRDGHIEVDLRQGAKVSLLVEALVARGAQIEEVRQGAASLEDAFLALVDEGIEEKGNDRRH